MTAFTSAKLTIQDIVLKIVDFKPENSEIAIAFNNVFSYFKYPYVCLPIELVGFPSVALVYLKLQLNGTILAEGKFSIEELTEKSIHETLVELKTPEEPSTPEKYASEQSFLIENLGFLKVLIEKNIDSDSCQLCPVFENFSTVSERTLEVIMEIDKNTEIKYKWYNTDLGIMLEELEYDKNAYNFNNLKCLVIGLNEKLKGLELVNERCGYLNLQIYEEQKSRENMQKSFKISFNEYMTTKTQLEKLNFDLSERCKVFAKKNAELTGIEKKLNDYKQFATAEIELLNSKIKELEQSQKKSSFTESIVNSLTEKLKFLESCKELQQSEYKQVVLGYENIVSDYKTYINSLVDENRQKTTEILKEKNMTFKLKNENEKLQTELIQQKSMCAEMQKKSSYIVELEKQLMVSEENCGKLKENCDNLKDQMEKLSQRYHDGSKSLYNDKIQLISSNKIMVEENTKLKQELNELKRLQFEQRHRFANASSRSTPGLSKIADREKSTGPESTQKVIEKCIEKNRKLLNDSKVLCETMKKYQTDIYKEYCVVVKELLQLSERHLMMQRLLSKNLLFLRDKDAENIVLRGLVTELQKNKPIYIPVHGDAIDNYLANYLNSQNFKLDVPFIRLEPGVYLYGNKRVVLKVENSGIVSNFYLVRVGGGYLKIEDYIFNNGGIETVKPKEEKKRNSELKLDFSDISRVNTPKYSLTQRSQYSAIPFNSKNSSIQLLKTASTPSYNKKNAKNLKKPVAKQSTFY